MELPSRVWGDPLLVPIFLGLRFRVCLLVGVCFWTIFPTEMDCARIQFLLIAGLRVRGLGFRV